MNLLIKLPTRERPEKFFKTLLKYQHLRTNENTKFLITLDENDSKMNQQSIRNSLSMWGNLQFVYGHSENKIHACNRDLNEYEGDWDIVLLASDDMIPQVEGYDQIIIDAMTKHFPDTDGALHFNDGYTQEKIVALPILGRKYYDKKKYIYHPDYLSLWCDEEMVHVLKAEKKSVYIDQVIIKHEHPMNNRQVKTDASYQRTLAFYQQDKETFERRKLNNFEMKLCDEVKVKNKGGRPKKVAV